MKYIKIFHAGELKDLENIVNEYLKKHDDIKCEKIEYIDLPGYDASVMLAFDKAPLEYEARVTTQKHSYYCNCHNCPSRTTPH